MLRIAVHRKKDNTEKTMNYLNRCLIRQSLYDKAFENYEDICLSGLIMLRYTSVGVLEILREHYSASEMYLLKVIELDPLYLFAVQMLMIES